MRFCCKEMRLFIEDPRDPIRYNNKFREYYIYIPRSHNIITMAYCPWCGKKLPGSLREKYFEILEEGYGLEVDIFSIKDNPNIPEEFTSDKWWKKRGL